MGRSTTSSPSRALPPSPSPSPTSILGLCATGRDLVESAHYRDHPSWAEFLRAPVVRAPVLRNNHHNHNQQQQQQQQEETNDGAGDMATRRKKKKFSRRHHMAGVIQATGREMSASPCGPCSRRGGIFALCVVEREPPSSLGPSGDEDEDEDDEDGHDSDGKRRRRRRRSRRTEESLSQGACANCTWAGRASRCEFYRERDQYKQDGRHRSSAQAAARQREPRSGDGDGDYGSSGLSQQQPLPPLLPSSQQQQPHAIPVAALLCETDGSGGTSTPSSVASLSPSPSYWEPVTGFYPPPLLPPTTTTMMTDSYYSPTTDPYGYYQHYQRYQHSQHQFRSTPSSPSPP